MREYRWRSSFGMSSFTAAFTLLLASTAGYTAADEYIVKVKGNQISHTVSALKVDANIKVNSAYPKGRLLQITIANDAKKASSIAKLLDRNDVEYVVPNIKMHSFAIPNDPQISKQWSLTKINAEAAWKLSIGSKKVVVAVIDTGIDTSHEDLQSNLWVNTKEVAGDGKDNDDNGYIDDVNGWDFLGNDNNPMDETGAQNPGHGSHCAGIVGAVGNNEKGISGMNQVVSLMPLRFLGADGSGDLMNAIKAIDYAIANGAQVISASFGATVPEAGAKPLIEAIDRAAAKGVIMVAAAANDGKNNDQVSVYPANAKNLISVAASDSDDKKPSWSNYGQKKVHLASPGKDILSTLPKNKYGNLSGTSMATPLVAGLVADMLSLDPNLTLDQTRALLQTTGVPVEVKTACDCRIDAGKAVEAALNKRLTPVPAAATLNVGDKLQFSAYGGKGPFTFTSSNAAIATMSESGELSAVAKGSVTVTVKDADEASSTSKMIWISETSATPPPGGDGECPFEDPMICAITCMIMPNMPWCEGGGGDGGEFPFPAPKKQ